MENYEFKTTFWSDFTIADSFGPDAVRDTFNRAFDGWKTNYEYLTELVMVLNWKLWQHYEHKDNIELVDLYNELYLYTNDYALNTLKDNELSYFLNVTD